MVAATLSCNSSQFKVSILLGFDLCSAFKRPCHENKSLTRLYHNLKFLVSSNFPTSNLALELSTILYQLSAIATKILKGMREITCTYANTRFNEVRQVGLRSQQQGDYFYLFINNRVTSQYIILHAPHALPTPPTRFITQQQVAFTLYSNICPAHKI